MAARKRPVFVVDPQDAELLPPAADALQQWFGSRLLAATDVLIWPTADRAGVSEGTKHVRLVFKGPALSIERNVYARDMLPNRHYETDISLQRVLGFDAEPWRDVGSSRIIGVRGELGQRLDADDTQYTELLGVIGETVGVALEKKYGTGVVVDVGLMPLEGAPLEPYYSARKKAWQPAGAPPPTLARDPYDVEALVGFGPRADLCRMYPRVTGCSRYVVAIRAGGVGSFVEAPEDHRFFTTIRKNGDFLVAHSTMPKPESAKLVRECGGWLFPSFGVGMVPSVTFGPLCLFASVDIVLNGLRPYRTGRGAWPINVYDTDVWTMKSQHLDAASRILYQQLTGTYGESEAGRYGAMGAGGAHQWILGAPTSLSSWGHEIEVTQIVNTAQLARELAERWKVWAYRDDGKSAEILDRVAMTRHRYPYLEAKANSLLDASCWQVAVCPKSWATQCRAYMRETGIEATLIVVPDPPSVERYGTEHWNLHGVSQDVGETHAYSQVVAEAAVAYAKREGRVRSYA
jgi:hypothetical protein